MLGNHVLPQCCVQASQHVQNVRRLLHAIRRRAHVECQMSNMGERDALISAD